MIAWTIEGALKSQKLNQLIVATDDLRIFDYVNSLKKTQPKVDVLMTPESLVSGTDRVFHALREKACDLVVNIQGDEPLIEGKLIDQLVESLQRAEDCMMASVCHPLDIMDLKNPDIVKVIENQHQEAIYFSRLPIPFSKTSMNPQNHVVFRHIGIYAFRKSFLEKFCTSPQAELELAENLEQLRALYLGAKIKMTHVDQYTQGVDRPEDILRVEKILLDRKL